MNFSKFSSIFIWSHSRDYDGYWPFQFNGSSPLRGKGGFKVAYLPSGRRSPAVRRPPQASPFPTEGRGSEHGKEVKNVLKNKRMATPGETRRLEELRHRRLADSLRREKEQLRLELFFREEDAKSEAFDSKLYGFVLGFLAGAIATMAVGLLFL